MKKRKKPKLRMKETKTDVMRRLGKAPQDSPNFYITEANIYINLFYRTRLVRGSKKPTLDEYDER